MSVSSTNNPNNNNGNSIDFVTPSPMKYGGITPPSSRS